MATLTLEAVIKPWLVWHSPRFGPVSAAVRIERMYGAGALGDLELIPSGASVRARRRTDVRIVPLGRAS